MWMRIAVRRLTVGCPTGMPDARGGRCPPPGGKRFQRRDFTLLFIHQDILSGVQGNPCTVIAAILQFLQSFNQDGISFFLAGVAYNSTHVGKNSIFILINRLRKQKNSGMQYTAVAYWFRPLVTARCLDKLRFFLFFPYNG